jgi:hypothetical protein
MLQWLSLKKNKKLQNENWGLTGASGVRALATHRIAKRENGPCAETCCICRTTISRGNARKLDMENSSIPARASPHLPALSEGAKLASSNATTGLDGSVYVKVYVTPIIKTIIVLLPSM